MIVKQSMYVLCALGFLCASYGLVSAQQQSPGNTPRTEVQPQTGIRGPQAGTVQPRGTVSVNPPMTPREKKEYCGRHPTDPICRHR